MSEKIFSSVTRRDLVILCISFAVLAAAPAAVFAFLLSQKYGVSQLFSFVIAGIVWLIIELIVYFGSATQALDYVIDGKSLTLRNPFLSLKIRASGLLLSPYYSTLTKSTFQAVEIKDCVLIRYIRQGLPLGELPFGRVDLMDGSKIFLALKPEWELECINEIRAMIHKPSITQADALQEHGSMFKFGI